MHGIYLLTGDSVRLNMFGTSTNDTHSILPHFYVVLS